MVICSPGREPRQPTAERPTPVARQVCPFVVCVDSRERAPWTFSQIVVESRLWMVPKRIIGLATGDYTIQNHEYRLVIERKSGADLVGSITHGNARFRREHERMHAISERDGFACVVVEASLSAICAELDADEGRLVTGDMIIGAAAAWPRRYRVPWFFAGDRRTAELLAFRIMLKWWKELER